MTKPDIERYINKIAEKSRVLAGLCTITTSAEASRYTTKLILFDFKEVSSIILEVMERLSSKVSVLEIYDATVALEKMEKIVLAELEALQMTEKQPQFSAALKSSLLTLLSAVKKCCSDYMHSAAKVCSLGDSLSPRTLLTSTPFFLHRILPRSLSQPPAFGQRLGGTPSPP